MSKKKTGTIKQVRKDGSLVKDDAGRTLFDLYFYVDRKQKHQRKYFKNRSEAQDYINNARQVEVVPGEWHAILDDWLAHVENSESHRGAVGASVKRLVKYLGTDPGPEGTRPIRMRDFLKWRADGVSPAAAAKDQRHLLALARWAKGQILISDIPWEGLAKPQYKQEKRSPIPLDHVPGLLDDLDLWTRPIAEWIANTGMRQQDAAKIQESDVLGDRVRVSVKSPARAPEVVEYLLDETLQKIIERARALKDEAGVKSFWLFCNSVGGRWTDSHLCHRIQEQWPPGVTLHCLRHTFGTEAGRHFSPDMIKSGMAHKSRATSERYSHVSEDATARQAVGARVRQALMCYNTNPDPQKQHTDNTQAQKTPNDAQWPQTETNKTEVTIGTHKAMIPKEVARELLHKYG